MYIGFSVLELSKLLMYKFHYDQVKRGLCAYDDKRYLLPDGISTLAHGHHLIRDLQRAPTEGYESDEDEEYAQRHHLGHGILHRRGR